MPWKNQKSIGMQVQADSPRQCLCTFSGENRTTCLMKGDHRGRTGCIYSHAGATEVKYIRNAIGSDTCGIAGGYRRVNYSEIVGESVGIVGTGNANKDAAGAAAERGWPDP